MIFEKLFGKKAQSEETIEDKVNGEIPSADIVAISMALHLFYDEVHDNESNVITIKRIERRYSPWSSKIYGINNSIR
jgi:glutaconyl-CoA/methylmalonyl-CoA decarboxylase subunit delta